MSRFRLAKLARFQAAFEDRAVAGTQTDCVRCSAEDRVFALLDILGTAPLDMLSLRDGKSSLDPRKKWSGPGSERKRLVCGKLSNEI